MEGEGDDKLHNGDVFITAVIEDSANGESVVSECEHSELGDTLLVQGQHVICSKPNYSPGITLLEHDIDKAKNIVDDKLSKSRGMVTESGINVKLTDSWEILRDDIKVLKFSSTDREYLENKVILEPFNQPASVQSGSESSHNELGSVCSLSVDSETSVGRLNGEAFNSQNLQHDPLVQLHRRALLDQQEGGADTACINNTLSEMPEATSMIKLRDTLPCNENGMTKVSSINHRKMTELNIKYDGNNVSGVTDCQSSDLDCGEARVTNCESVSDDELHGAVDSSTCVQSLLEIEQDVSVCRNDIDRVPDTCTIRGDTVNNPAINATSIVSPGSRDSTDVAIAEHHIIHHDLSSVVTQTGLGLFTLQPPSLEAEDVSGQDRVGPQWAESERTKGIHCLINNHFSSSHQNKSVEHVGGGTFPDASSNTTQEVPSHCKNAGSQSCNTFSQLNCSREECNMDTVLPQKALNIHIDSSVRDLNKDGIVAAEVIHSNDGENVIIELSQHEGCENVCAVSGTECTTLDKDVGVDDKHGGSHLHELPGELDCEDDGLDKPGKGAAVAGEVDGHDEKHEEGESSDRDEGELSDDDFEEGEIKEPGSKKSQIKSVCPFLQKGGCTWGVACRFLHPGVNDKGNYQMLEVPGLPASRARLESTGLWPKLPQEHVALAAKVQEVPLTETAWERGLRLAKEQKKKATERRVQESGCESSLVEKESERVSKFVPRLPYYDQPAYEEDMYYKSPGDLLQVGHYEDFQARHNQHSPFASPYQAVPSAQYAGLYNPLEKFDRNGLDHREQFRPGADSLSRSYTPPPNKRPDEWIDPWMRSKSPPKDKGQRGRRRCRSKSDYSHSSRSSSGSSSSLSRSSRSVSNSSASSREKSRSAVPGKGATGYDYRTGSTGYQQGSYRGGSYGGGGAASGIVYAGRNIRNRSKDRFGRRIGRPSPDRPLPYARRQRKSGSSCSDSSSSRSRSRRRKPSSRSSKSSSSSSSPAAAGNPSTKARRTTATKGNTSTSHPKPPVQPASQKELLPYPPFRLDQIPHPSEPNPTLPGAPAAVKSEPAGLKAPLKAKEPQKPVIPKPSVKLTILPKLPTLDIRPNPLDSPPPKQQLSGNDILDVGPAPLESPSLKRQLSDDDDVIVVSATPGKKVNLPTTLLSAQRSNPEKSIKRKKKPNKEKAAPFPAALSKVAGSKLCRVQTPGGLLKLHSTKTVSQTAVTKTTSAGAMPATTTTSRPKKKMLTSRKELLKQLKAVEEAIARKKSQLQ